MSINIGHSSPNPHFLIRFFVLPSTVFFINITYVIDKGLLYEYYETD
jgi:hypothetical protein